MNLTPGASILCMFSGGVDSTGVLHELLTKEEFESHPLIIHHIHIINRENRAKAEAKATQDILKKYQEKGCRDFLYSESTFNTAGFAPLKSSRFPFDMDICAFIAGNLCAARPEISYVAMGRTKTDVDGGGEYFRLRMRRAQAIFESVLALEKKRDQHYIFPVIDKSKGEIWKSIPEEIREHIWWCRRPTYENDKAVACGVCNTCKQMNEQLSDLL